MLATGGVRLYIDTDRLDVTIERLQREGVTVTKQPAIMPWGWKHAYLDDPGDHEISLYWAGEKRLQQA